MLERVWAIKNNANPNRSTLGYVSAVLKQEDEILSAANPEDFPQNGQIFITAEYDNQIDFVFEDFEIFEIKAVTGGETSGDCTYIAHGNSVQKHMSKTELCNVFRTKMKIGDKLVCSSPIKPMETYHFVLNELDNCLYGPFSGSAIQGQNGYEIALDPLPSIAFMKAHKPFHVAKIPVDIMPQGFLLNLEIGTRGRGGYFSSVTHSITLLSACSDLDKLAYEWIDFISDEALVKWGNDCLGSTDGKIGRKQRQEFVQKVRELKNASPSRVSRLETLVTELDQWELKKENLITDFLKSNSPEAQSAISSFVKNNSTWIKDENAELKKELEGDLLELEGRKLNLKNQIGQLESEKEQITQSYSQKSLEKVKEENSSLETQREALVKELAQLDAEKTKLLEEIDNISAVSDLNNRKIYLTESIIELKEEEKSLKDSIRTLRYEYLEDSDKLRKEAGKILPFLEIFNTNGAKQENSQSFDIQEIETMKFARGADIIEQVSEFCEQSNRSIPPSEIANYMVSIGQSFLTVLSGHPGVGKTTLAQLLAQALGLHNQILTVPVARGWTSQRDILGYHNPLTGNFEKARTGLYDKLVACKQEHSKLKRNQIPSLVLLDEANLSPIEHYWSSFLTHCDTDTTKKLPIDSMSHSSTYELEITDNLRFMATINHDVTTEPLSHRLLDRVPIITLNPPRNVDRPKQSKRITAPIDFDSFKNAFKITNDDADYTTSEEDIIREIQNALMDDDPKLGNIIPLSARKQNAILSYVVKANEYMDNNLEALDYAVLQMVLPLVGGYGESFKTRLKRLQEIVTPLPKTSKHLERMLTVGETKHFSYSYFV